MRCIEILAPAGAPLAVWRRETGDGFPSIEPLLVPTDRLAARWPGARPDYPMMRVVDHGDGRFVAVCDEEISPREELSRESIVMHRVDERRLRVMLCAALVLEVSRSQVCRLPGLLRIGDWQPKPAARFPVVLTIATTPAHFAELIVHTISAAARPTLLLTPTRAMWSDRSDAVADPSRVTLVPLDAVLKWSEKAWRAAGGWDDYLGAFVQNAGVKLRPGYSTVRRKTRVAKAGGTAAKIKDELNQRYRSSRAHLLDTGEVLPAPEVKEIARVCGISPSTASRWLNGKYRERDQELKILWQNIANPEHLRNFRL